MQEQRYLGRLEPGMDVCDVDGNKFGTIERAFRHELAPESTSETGAPVGTMTREDILQVKTGLLGLGKHYYIPFSAIQDVTSGCVFVDQSKDRIDEMGWDVRPDYLDSLS
jgi:hypothetical protein